MFLQYAQKHTIFVNKTCFYTCTRCLDPIRQNIDRMCDHLFKFTIMSYIVGTDDLSFSLVDLNKMNYTNEPFIMASEARQIFYVTNPANIISHIGRTKHARKS